MKMIVLTFTLLLLAACAQDTLPQAFTIHLERADGGNVSNVFLGFEGQNLTSGNRSFFIDGQERCVELWNPQFTKWDLRVWQVDWTPGTPCVVLGKLETRRGIVRALNKTLIPLPGACDENFCYSFV